MEDARTSYLALGSACLDEVPGAEVSLGGSVYFSAGQAHAIGCAVAVHTACTPSTARRLSDALPVDVVVRNQTSAVDTRFSFDAGPGTGPQRVVSVGPAVRPESEVGRFDVVHFAPVFGEVTAGLVAAVRGGASFTGMTPQGAMRVAGRDGEIGLQRELEEGLVAGVDAIVLSEEEHDRLSDSETLKRFGGWLFVTRGGAGASLFRDGRIVADCPLDADSIASPVRTIGAGDVFAATAFVTLARGDGPSAALSSAVAAASQFVRDADGGVRFPGEVVR